MIDIATKYSYTLIAQALEINGPGVSALACGMGDGHEQGFELSMGMSYDDLNCQWAYDVGTYIGASLAVRGGKHD